MPIATQKYSCIDVNGISTWHSWQHRLWFIHHTKRTALPTWQRILRYHRYKRHFDRSAVPVFVVCSIRYSRNSNWINSEIGVRTVIMETIKFSNKCVYRDADGHLYRLNKKSIEANKPNYFVCYIKKCNAKLKVTGDNKQITEEHTHSDKLAKREFTKIKFDINLVEHLSTIDINAFSNDQVYEQVLTKSRVAKFDGDHKRKKIQIIKTHRCNMKKCEYM